MALFRDRREAGRRLADALSGLAGKDALVLGLPRGGVPVAAEVARRLGAELDVLVARKLGVPGHPELGFGAIAPGVRVIDGEMVDALGLEEADVAAVEEAERRELDRRQRAYRDDRPPPRVEARTVVVVDDGVATGGTAKAALRSVRRGNPKRLLFAAPVGPRDAEARLAGEADEVVLAEAPDPFHAVGVWYDSFEQTTDDEVRQLLIGPGLEALQHSEQAIPAGGASLGATLTVPPQARGLVVFAHGSGSSRHSPRNHAVAQRLQARGLATLLLDLLTPEEERVDALTREHRFDIALLAHRLRAALAWAAAQPALAKVPVGLFGSSTGAAAALVAAASEPGVQAVVSRGGRPDLAGDALPSVMAATLLIVGGRDAEVLALNRQAQARMQAPVELKVVAGATHLFEERGALEEVASLAAAWFARWLGPAPPASRRPKRPATRAGTLLPARAVALVDEGSLDPLLERIGDARIVMLGESTHGTHEFYEWRRRITLRLVREKGFRFVGVEGDWPDCFRLNRFVKAGAPGGALDALRDFARWPTWMWANHEVAQLLEDVRAHNAATAVPKRVGFYGLDVYSLRDSLHAVLRHLEGTRPAAAQAARAALACFEPHGSDPHGYALGSVLADCRAEVARLLAETRRSLPALPDSLTEARLDAEQNAHVAARAEAYYRATLRGGPASWNLRDVHMMDTLDRLLEHHGPAAKAVVWAHNTHVGDARATDMVDEGLLNLGQLARQRHGRAAVVLVGFGTHRGSVIAGRAWEAPMERMPVPPARRGSLEERLHAEAPTDRLFILDHAADMPRLMHRAIGVVYHPEAEAGNYVPTDVPGRYDAFLFIDQTRALHPIHLAAQPERTPETWPTGF